MQLHIHHDRLVECFDTARQDGRMFLFEHETYDLLRHSGAESPPRVVFIQADDRPTDRELMALPGDTVVMKIVCPTILHKTEVGGVRVIEKTPERIRSARRRMLAEVPLNYASWIENHPDMAPAAYAGLDAEALKQAIAKDLRGVLLCQFMPPDSDAFGNELLVSLRRTREFGLVITAGLGGTDTELYAERFKKGQAVVCASVALTEPEAFFELFRTTIAYRKLAGLSRGQKRRVSDDQLRECFASFIAMGRHYSPLNPAAPYVIEELEINPFSFSDYLMVSLDGMCRFSLPGALPQSRPVTKIEALLHPKSMAIIGVSANRMNFGRIILKNVLANGFDPTRITILKPGCEAIDGIACVAGVEDLKNPVDLLVVAVGADRVPDLVHAVISKNAARAVMLIPGGMGEKAGSEDRAATVKNEIESAHGSNDGGPVFLGGNCLGVVSHPGRYDTLFIPEEKLPKRRGEHPRHVAFISQSGAFMITRASKYPFVDPAYMISIGNQIDLSVGDLVTFMAEVDTVGVIAVYLEGFQDLDGVSLCRAVKTAVENGKEVVFYKAGRTPEGKSATSSHTASVAGDPMVCESCVHQAGAMVARDFSEFDDLLVLSATLRAKAVHGNRLAAVSGAGFEAVGMADSIRGEDFQMRMARLTPESVAGLSELIRRKHLDGLVDIQNPMDINPAADDETHVGVARILMADPGVDGVVLGLDPLSPATETLMRQGTDADGPGETKNLVGMLAELFRETEKALVGVIDGGALYDPLAERLIQTGIPVFRSSARAVAALAKYINGRLHAETIRQGKRQAG